jgi:CheY-like chemotaxis protein
VERACTGRYDTVLMDIQMPDIDGMEATRLIRQRLGAAAPRIVAMTAHSLSGDRERCLAAGMDGYLAKPINPAAFAAELGRPLRSVAEPAAREDGPRAPEPAPAEGLVDRVRIQALLEYDDEEQSMVRAIIDTFLHDAPRYLEAVRDAHARHDYAQLAHHAHALKGAASNAAAAALSEIASRLETLARNGERDDLARLVEKLVSTYERSVVALVAEREQLARSR